MFKQIGILITILGAIFIYLSHNNQNLLKIALKPRWKYLGNITLLIGLKFLCSNQIIIGVFMWLICLGVILSFIPFIQVIFKNDKSIVD